MSISDDLDKVKPRTAQPCSIAEAIAAHPDIADDIAEACMRRDRSARVIIDVLARYGVTLKTAAVAKHRRGDCQCR